ncbi:hypothetical protein K2X33_10425 [bacterium]|nr:hypothetical protein [bacterium]
MQKGFRGVGFWVLFSVLVVPCWGTIPEGQTETLSRTKTAKSSLAPLAAYTPTFGVLVGLGYFRKPAERQGLEMGAYSMVSFKPSILVDATVDYHWTPELRFRNALGFSTFLASYYGEGGQTRRQDNVMFPKVSTFAKTGIAWERDGWALWPHLDYRGWHEQGGIPHFPEEDRIAAALTAEYQTPDRANRLWAFHPQVTLRAAAATSRAPSFAQAELDLRAFFQPVTDLVFASRAYFATSWGEPSYTYRYTGGGAGLLRGYFENRFRGKSLAAVQEEIRFPIAGAFSGAVFADAGDVSDGIPNRWKVTYGGGLRFAIPPDRVAKVRLDIGVSQDQVGAFFLFGDTF